MGGDLNKTSPRNCVSEMLKPGWHSRISFLTDVSCGGNEVRVMNTDEMSCVCVCVCTAP